MNQGLTLTGSAPPRGQPAYTDSLEASLFQPLLPEVRASFAAGDGSELGFTGNPGKMQAVHSSSALAVNVFQYWKSIGQVPAIAAACGLCKPGPHVALDLQFEEKCPINKSFVFHPNIDVVIHNNTPGAKIKRFAVECNSAKHTTRTRMEG
ncbi:MAG: hypothetical protein IPK16_25900 [Anaerolineales bacterium]|nr:hypothetical protein [Anaerolineales bacterium]